MSPTVRRAVPDDARAVREIATESWHAAYDDVLGTDTVVETIDRWYELADLEAAIVDARDIEGIVFLVAEDGNELVGFAQAGPHRDQPAVASLSRIYVRPDRWGEGIGTALLERLEDDLEAYDRLCLAVLADNDVGVSFYESTGFERVGVQESNLEDGLEEYVYEKPL
ncbi:GNAT family N-acetyltransferase [Natrialbaceae archaeon AArc-T1-2]|uniref:GNAT family N-acetyltransferase n=1 Tax=Natrialbaceae archaeon AArc-T1-2 TaxID=3053904 RepID=UPI00255A9386|nr:GNAT family N-acetyltransferase [Natrialbaceae archaeon AArc-T1-2]WIV67825.1 GNAT family N-acetyltransferase [Natrialbaceae archaeon AArc-T1-2]